jgi:hypothetical protein
MIFILIPRTIFSIPMKSKLEHDNEKESLMLSCFNMWGVLPTKAKPKKFQGYDDVVYKRIKRYIAQNVVTMDPLFETIWGWGVLESYCKKTMKNSLVEKMKILCNFELLQLTILSFHQLQQQIIWKAIRVGKYSIIPTTNVGRAIHIAEYSSGSYLKILKICSFWRYVQLSTITSNFWQVTILKVVHWFKVENYIPKVTILWPICYTYIFVITFFFVWNFEWLGQVILISIAMDLRSNTFQPKKRFNRGKLGICLTKFALLLKGLLFLFWALSTSTTFVFPFSF